MSRPKVMTHPNDNRTVGASAAWCATVVPLREQRGRILYVDDDSSLRRLGELALSRAGFDVDTAGNGREAWAALNSREYQMLITDHDMPEMTGLVLVALARRAGMTLPIVLASGSLDPLLTPLPAKLGLTAFLPKPFSSATLVDVVIQGLPSQTADFEAPCDNPGRGATASPPDLSPIAACRTAHPT